MLKISRTWLTGLLAGVFLLSTALAPQGVSAATTADNQRFYGNDRYATAVDISQEGWSKSDYAIISAGSDKNLVDALTAAPLAKAKDAPVLLTDGNKLTASTKQELTRLGVKTVYVTSGTGVIKQSVLNELQVMGLTVENLGGHDRYETSVNIAQELGAFNQIVVTTGSSNADALSVASIAASQGMPILLSGPNGLPASVAEFLDANPDITTSYVIGGTKVVSDSVKNSLPGEAIRIGGADRYDTNRKVLAAFKNDLTYDRVYVASGDNKHLVDALTGSALAAKTSAPILLTGANLQQATKDYAKLNLATEIVAFGGATVVTDSTLNQLASSTAISQNGTTVGSANPDSPQKFTDTVKILGDDVNIKNSQLDYSIYVSGNNATLSNLTVKGTVFLDPGAQGVANLNNVQAENIVVLSGAKESIHLDSVDAGSLLVSSASEVRIETTGTTKVDTTVVNSPVVLAANGGSFGNIEAQSARGQGDPNSQNSVELVGVFDKPVILKGNVALKSSNATVPEVEIAAKSPSANITLEGNFEFVKVNSQATVTLAADTAIANTVINSSAILDASVGTFGQVEVASAGAMAPVVELRGTFNDSVVVTGGSTIKAGENAVVARLEVALSDSAEEVLLEGIFETVEVNTEANIQLGSGTRVTNVITNARADITLTDDTAGIGSLTDAGASGSAVWDADGNTVDVPEVPLDPNTLLSSIEVAGVPLVDFDPEFAYYYVELPVGETAVPEVTAVAVDPTAEVAITAAEQVPGYANIDVIAADGTVVTYTIEFVVGQQAALDVAEISTPYKPNEVNEFAVTLDPGDQSGDAYVYLEFSASDGITPDDLLAEVDMDGDGIYSPLTLTQSGDLLIVPSGQLNVKLEPGVVTNMNLRLTFKTPDSYFIWVTVMDVNTDYQYAGYWTFADVLDSTSDSSLSSLLVDGTPIDGFDPLMPWYQIELAPGITDVPVVAAATTEPSATAVVTPAQQLPGYTVIEVTAMDGTASSYIIDFYVGAPASLTVTEPAIPLQTNVANEYVLALDPGEQNGEAYVYFQVQDMDGMTIDDLAVEIDIDGDGVYTPLALTQSGEALTVSSDAIQNWQHGIITTINLRVTAKTPGYYIGFIGVTNGDKEYLYAAAMVFAEVQ